MQNVVVRAAGDDGRIGELAFVSDEFMRELGLDFGFVHAGLHEFAGADETPAGQVARGPDGVNLG